MVFICLEQNRIWLTFLQTRITDGEIFHYHRVFIRLADPIELSNLEQALKSCTILIAATVFGGNRLRNQAQWSCQRMGVYWSWLLVLPAVHYRLAELNDAFVAPERKGTVDAAPLIWHVINAMAIWWFALLSWFCCSRLRMCLPLIWHHRLVAGWKINSKIIAKRKWPIWSYNEALCVVI